MYPQPPGPLKRAGLLGVQYAGGSHSSLGSQLSIYSAAGGGKGDYDISGEVLVGIRYVGNEGWTGGRSQVTYLCDTS